MRIRVFHFMPPYTCNIFLNLKLCSILGSLVENMLYFVGKSYFADLRMTFRQKYFLQDWFGNKLGVGLG